MARNGTTDKSVLERYVNFQFLYLAFNKVLVLSL